MRLRYLGLLAIVSLTAVVLAACGGGASPTATTAPKPAATTAATATTTVPTTAAVDYTIKLLGNASGSYQFDPKDLSLTAGRTYTIKLTSDAEPHTWSVKDPKNPGKYLVDSGFLTNDSKTIQFTAPAAGTYVLVCIPHESLGMKGTITTQ